MSRPTTNTTTTETETNLVYATQETSEENSDGIALTLYFRRSPSREEVLAAAQDPNNLCSWSELPEEIEYDTFPTPVSQMAGLVRIQVFG